jgi:hypothetical protein
MSVFVSFKKNVSQRGLGSHRPHGTRAGLNRNELRARAAKNGQCDCSTQMRDHELTSSCERSHSVDKARVRPKLKHTVVYQLGFEVRTLLNGNP